MRDEVVKLLLPFSGFFAAGLGLIGWASVLVVAKAWRWWKKP